MNKGNYWRELGVNGYEYKMYLKVANQAKSTPEEVYKRLGRDAIYNCAKGYSEGIEASVAERLFDGKTPRDIAIEEGCQTKIINSTFKNFLKRVNTFTKLGPKD